MRRVTASVLVGVGVLGLVASIALTVVGLRLVGAVEEAVTATVDAGEQTVDALDEVLAVVGDVTGFVEQFGLDAPLADDLAVDRQLLERTEQDVRAQLRLGRLLVAGGGLLLGATQLVPLWLGWVLWDLRRVHRALGLDQLVDRDVSPRGPAA